MADEYHAEPCRSCTAPIIWTTTERGKDMPVDALPAAGGTVRLWRDPVGKVRSAVVAAHLAYGRRDLRVSHFARCPEAGKWRRR